MRAVSGGSKIRALGEMVVVDGALASVIDGRKGVHDLDDGVMACGDYDVKPHIQTYKK